MRKNIKNMTVVVNGGFKELEALSSCTLVLSHRLETSTRHDDNIISYRNYAKPLEKRTVIGIGYCASDDS